MVVESEGSREETNVNTPLTPLSEPLVCWYKSPRKEEQLSGEHESGLGYARIKVFVEIAKWDMSNGWLDRPRSQKRVVDWKCP